MRFRTYKNTDLTVSEVGFGLWTISTGWWGNFTEGEAIALMHKAFDLGITLFDAADTSTISSPMAKLADAGSARFRRIFRLTQLCVRRRQR